MVALCQLDVIQFVFLSFLDNYRSRETDHRINSVAENVGTGGFDLKIGMEELKLRIH